MLAQGNQGYEECVEVAWLKKGKAEASEAKTLTAVHAGLYPGLEPHTVQGSPVHRV